MAYENLSDTETSKIIIDSYLAVEKYARATSIARPLGEIVFTAEDSARAQFEPDYKHTSGEDRWLGLWITLNSSIGNNGIHADPEHVLKIAHEYVANPVLPKDIITES